MNKRKNSRGFTIVELLVVIVVIGILAAISLVSYSNISQKAVIATVQSDLSNASKMLKIYKTLYDSYPTSLDVNNCPSAPTPDTKYCLKSSSGSTIVYSTLNPQTFHVTATKDVISYSMTDSTKPAVATTATSCPSGFIPVPGSGTYGTNDFCVMKYEAKDSGDHVTPVSVAAGTPWVSITQPDAATYSANACSGCHLITDAEWLTIAQNVLSVNSNWSTNTVGSGYIYIGHTDSAPNNALDASTNDGDGYYGTGNAGDTQRRTLALTNGQTIWDFAGNVWDWTSGVTASGTISQPGNAGGGFNYYNWNAVTTHGSLSPDPFPSYGTPAASAWDCNKGIGTVYGNADDTTQRGLARGGRWVSSCNGGVHALSLSYTPSTAVAWYGFRVAR